MAHTSSTHQYIPIIYDYLHSNSNGTKIQHSFSLKDVRDAITATLPVDWSITYTKGASGKFYDFGMVITIPDSDSVFNCCDYTDSCSDDTECDSDDIACSAEYATMSDGSIDRVHIRSVDTPSAEIALGWAHTTAEGVYYKSESYLTSIDAVQHQGYCYDFETCEASVDIPPNDYTYHDDPCFVAGGKVYTLVPRIIAHMHRID